MQRVIDTPAQNAPEAKTHGQPTPVQRFDIPNPLDAAKKLAEQALGAIKNLGSAAFNTAQSLGNAALNTAVSAGTTAWNTIKGAGQGIFNTAKGLAESAWNTAKSVGTGAWNSVKGMATQVWNNAKQLGMKAWDTAKGLSTSAWNFAKSAGGKAWDTAKGLGTKAWDTAKSLGSKAWDGAKNFAGKAINGVKSFGGKVWTTVKGAAGKAWDAAKGLGGKAVEIAKSVADKLSPNDLCATAGKLLAKTYAKVSPYVKKAWEGAKKLGGAAWAKAKDFGGKLWSTAKDWGGKAANFAKDLVGSISKTVKNLAGSAWNEAKKLGGQVVSGAKTYASKAWDTAKQMGTAAWDGAKGMATGLYNSAKSLGSAAVEKATGLAKGAWDTAKSLGSKIASQAQSAASGLFGLADKLTGGAASKVAGMAQSILGKASGLLSWVVNTARDLANKAINAAKDFASKALAKAKELGGKALNAAKDYAQQTWDKAKALGTSAINAAKDWAGKAWDTAKQWGTKAIADARSWADKAWAIAKDYGSKALADAKKWSDKAWAIAKDYGGKAWSDIKNWGGKVWKVAKGVGSTAWGYAKQVGGKVVDYAKGAMDGAWKLAKGLGSKAYGIVRDAVSKLNAKKLLGLAAILGIPAPLAGGYAAVSAIIALSKTKCVKALAPALAGPIADIEKNAPMLRVVLKVAENPDAIVEATKATIAPMIAKIGPAAKSTVTGLTSKFGDRMKKHIANILFYLEAGIVDLGNTWWEQLKKMGRSLLFPWEGMGAELSSMGGDISKAVSNLWQWPPKVGNAIDNMLSMLRTLNGVVGNWYGWFAIIVILGGLLLSTVTAGISAGAGLALAGEVGEGLLLALVITEGATIAKAEFDLVKGDQNADEDEADEKQIASSAITLGITGALVLLGGLTARFAKAVFGGLKKLFQKLKAPKVEVKVPGGEKPNLKPGEKPGGEKPSGEEPSPAELKAKMEEHVRTEDGKHETFNDDKGASMCSGFCDLLRRKFKDVIKSHPEFEAKLNKLDNMPEKTAKQVDAKRAAREAMYEQLRDARLNDILDEIEEKFRKQIDKAEADGPPGKADDIRFQRYLEKCDAKVKEGVMDKVDILSTFDEWFKKSRGGRHGGPGHRIIQNVLADPTLHPGARAEFPVPGTGRFADAFWPKGADGHGRPTYHQIGGRNPVRGDPIARERAAIEDIRRAVGREADIFFWDKRNPGAAPQVNPDLKPDWVPAGKGD